MAQSYAVVLSVSFALIAAGFRPSASFGIHEEESHREPPLERSPPSRFPGSRDHGRPHDDHRSPPPPSSPKGEHHSEHFEDREDAEDDDDVEDELRLEHRQPFRKYGQTGSDARRMEGTERDRDGNNLRRYDGRDDEGRSPPFNRMLDVRRPSGGDEERRLADELEDWWKTGWLIN